jgi:Gpi18-like mannosyltransferase
VTAPRRREVADWRFVLLAFAASRAFVFAAFAFAAAKLYPPFSATALERAFVQWDATWLLQIAAHGYREAHEQAYFPAFPLLVRGLTALGLHPVFAAVAINHLLLLVACLLLFQLSDALVGRRTARGAVLVLLLHPLSFYFSVPYSEALFLAASLAAVAAARSGHAWAAGLAGALAVLTRNTGIFLLPALVWMLRATPRKLPWLLPLPSALGLWMSHGARTHGDPLLFIHAQAHWDMFLTWPRALWRDLGRYRAWTHHHLPFSLLGIVLAVRVARQLPRPFILYVAGPLVLSFCLPKLAITPRLHLVLFPLWIVAAQWLEGRSRRLVLVLLALAALALQWSLVGRYAATLWVD